MSRKYNLCKTMSILTFCESLFLSLIILILYNDIKKKSIKFIINLKII